jgi:DNA-directed RNA polymerase sigma subunit (sigma70/sigma32)
MSRSAKDLDMLIEGDAHRMGDPYGDDPSTVTVLARKYGLTPEKVRDILDEAAAKSSDDY